MQVSANIRENTLSVLLDLAVCDFVRINEYQEGRTASYQFGDEKRCLSILNNESENITEFVTEQSITAFEHQFNISISNAKCLHIECYQLTQQDKSNDNLRQETRHIEQRPQHQMLDFVNSHALPDFLLEFAKVDAHAKPRKELLLLLKAIVSTLHAFMLIKQYQKLTSDSLTKLKSRSALQREIDEKIVQANMALCMVHCSDFQNVNRKFGQAKGDTVLQEIAGVLDQQTRNDDVAGRFGGALFGIAVEANSIDDAHTLANKLQQALHNKHYLKNAVRLTFNFGIAFITKEEAQLDLSASSSLLINRAEQALKAAQNSLKPSIVQWEADKFRMDEQEFNYLGGIFTPDNVTNYRNMLLLWDISSIIADEHSFSRLFTSVVERLAFTFEFSCSGIVSVSDLHASNASSNPDNSKQAKSVCLQMVDGTEIQEVDWQKHENKAIVHENAQNALQDSKHIEFVADNINGLVIPLGTSNQECFFIVGELDKLALAHDTVMLFVGFARQLGKALKRSQLEDELNKNLEQQNAKLEQELLELKAGLQSSALVYRSKKMQKIVEQTQRAAQTDTTVLITGESGTGKEKLINAIHTLSPRSNKPLVIVDCGSIPETLIESELFGHTKGAFTGAQSDNKGKIQAANGGILVLDEIGELPMSMQPKLLRFVQEKHYTPVGSNKAVDVNVKIVAVTNRDLAFEVSQGRFRKDLYYRLNVVSLHSPPLRDRIEDIELLCQHFLSKFARQFETDKKRLSQHTIAAMKSYPWPGNIRELENRLMQASLLTSETEIQLADLNIDTQGVASDDLRQNPAIPQTIEQPPTYEDSSNINHTHSSSSDQQSENGGGDNKEISSSQMDDEHWESQFLLSLTKLLSSLDMRILINLPLGSLVESKLLQMAQQRCHSHSKTAVLLQMPISTARRKLNKDMPDFTQLEGNPYWQKINSLFGQIVEKQIVLQSPVELARKLTAKAILEQHVANMALASQIMDVSEPTMYKFRKELNH